MSLVFGGEWCVLIGVNVQPRSAKLKVFILCLLFINFSILKIPIFFFFFSFPFFSFVSHKMIVILFSGC